MHRPSPVIARLTAACSKSHGCRHLRWIVPSVRTYILKKWAPDITSTRSSPLCRRGTSTFERKGGERAAEEVAVKSEGSPLLHRAPVTTFPVTTSSANPAELLQLHLISRDFAAFEALQLELGALGSKLRSKLFAA